MLRTPVRSLELIRVLTLPDRVAEVFACQPPIVSAFPPTKRTRLPSINFSDGWSLLPSASSVKMPGLGWSATTVIAAPLR